MAELEFQKAPGRTVELQAEVPDLEIYPDSTVATAGRTYALARSEKGKQLLIKGEESDLRKAGFEGRMIAGRILLGETTPANAAALRKALLYLSPVRSEGRTSIGLGDRLGLATPGHIRAIEGTGLFPYLAQQSIREMARTGRTPQQVMDEALWGVFQAGYTDGFGSDADHLKTPADLADCLRAGFTLFTIDPGDQVDNQADTDPPETLLSKCRALESEAADLSLDRLRKSYLSGRVSLPGGSSLEFSETELLRAAVKYGRAINHTVAMYRALKSAAAGRHFELEMSVDETLTPTTVGEHYFVASELARAGVAWVSLAPRFVGRFEKGVDYIGDLGEFRKELVRHRAVARHFGNYKLSIHSGSDKFSLYPAIAEVTEGMVHLKTAGTSYLEAIRTIASVKPELYRAIYRFARERYETDRASYHVSARLDRVPPESALSNGELEASLDDFHTRQVLHVTFGSVLTARAEDGSYRFRTEIYRALEEEELEHYRFLARHLGRHARPFAR